MDDQVYENIYSNAMMQNAQAFQDPYAQGFSRQDLMQGAGGQNQYFWRPENSNGNYMAVPKSFVDMIAHNAARGVQYYGDPFESSAGSYSLPQGLQQQEAPQPEPQQQGDPRLKLMDTSGMRDMSNGGRSTVRQPSEWNDEDPAPGGIGMAPIPGEGTPGWANNGGLPIFGWENDRERDMRGTAQPRDSVFKMLLQQIQHAAQPLARGARAVGGKLRDISEEGLFGPTVDQKNTWNQWAQRNGYADRNRGY